MFSSKQRFTRFTLFFVVGVLLLTLGAHIGGAYLLRHQFEKQLHPDPATGTYLGEIHLNLFTGYLHIQGLAFKPEETALLQLGQLYLKISPWALLRGEVVVEQLDIESGYWRVQRLKDGSIDFALPLRESSANSEKAEADALPVFLQQANIKRVVIDYRDAGQQALLNVQQLSLADLDLSQPELPAQLEASLAWDRTRVSVEGALALGDKPGFTGTARLSALSLKKLFKLARQPVHLEAEVAADLHIALKQELTVKGGVQASNILMLQEGFELQAERLELPAFTLALNLDKPSAMQLALLNVQIKDWKFKQNELLTAQAEQIALQGGLQLNLAKQQFSIDKATLLLRNLGLQQSQQKVSIKQLSAHSIEAAESPFNAPHVAARVQAVDVILQHASLPPDGLKIAQAELGNLIAEGDQFRLSAVALDSINVQDSSYTLEKLQLDKADISSKVIDLGDFVVQGLQARVLRDAKGVWQLPVATKQASKEAKPDGSHARPLAWRINSVTWKGDNRIDLQDQSMKPALRQNLQITQLELGALDSRKPDLDTALRLKIKPDEYSLLKFTGQLRPLANAIYVNANGQLSGMGLSSLNPLVENDLGHKFLKGQLDDSFVIKIENDKLKMTNQIDLLGLDVQPIEGMEGPPLVLAVSLLEDNNGRFSLAVPIDGDLNNPDFRVLAALNPIILKAVAGAAAIAIQPLGSVLLVGSLLANQAMKVSFDPALFEAKSSSLKSGAVTKLKQLAAKLKSKPKLSLRLCGITAQVDRTKDKKTGKFIEPEDQLLKLAGTRAEKVRSVLLNAGVVEKQLRSCRPQVDAAEKTQPRVEIRL